MWRGIISIIALLLMCGALAIIIPILIIPNMGFHTLVPVLQPLHQALACEAGETLTYDYDTYDGYTETHFRCVDAAGRERDVDRVLQTPANYAIGVFCLGGLLMLVPFLIAVRQGMMMKPGLAAREALQQMRQPPTESTVLSASGQQQLDALDKLRAQGFIAQEDYEIAKKRILDNFSAT